MDEYLQTALEGLRIVITFYGLVYFLGAGPTSLLLPEDWRRYRLLLTPIVGWCLLVLALFAINMVAGVRSGMPVVLVAAAAADGVALWRRRRRWKAEIGEPLVPLWMGVALVALALIPQVAQRSLGLLSLNMDEEVYYPATSYILAYPATGGPHRLTEQFLEGISLYGWAFQHTMAAVSALTGYLPFVVYIPTTYCLLGLSVPAWYIFYREVLGLGQRGSLLASCFYTFAGLPLWFATYGYGPQMASLVAIPVGTVALLGTIGRGGVRRTALGGIIIAAGLASYYRVIALHYLFTLAPVVALVAVRQRHYRPVVRAAAVAVAAFVVGLPSHWHVLQWYFLQGAIEQARNIGENWSEGWGVTRFESPSVGLGLEAYEWVHRVPGDGAATFLRQTLDPYAAPVTGLLLAVALLGLVGSVRRRPEAAVILAGFAAYMAFDRFVLDFKYGYFKLLAAGAPLVYGYLVLGVGIPRGRSWRSWPVSPRLLARAAVGMLLAVVAVYLLHNSYESIWFSASGWGWSIPSSLALDLHQMGRTVEPGARVFIAGRFEYPIPPDRLELRQDHIFGMKTPDEEKTMWARRVRAMAMAELLHADVYGYFDTLQVWRHYNRLLPDEAYDYYLLAPENDPRLDGLDRGDLVWSGSDLALYRSRGVVRETPWTLWQKRGSLAIFALKPLSFTLGGRTIRFAGDPSPAGQVPQPPGRLRIGLLAFSETWVSIEAGDFTRRLDLQPGLTWYTTPTIPMRGSVEVQTMGDPLGVVALRVLEPGSEERELVPPSVIRDDLYASSSVLRLENWLTDPFRGKGPGSL